MWGWSKKKCVKPARLAQDCCVFSSLWVLCREGHSPVLLCAGVMAGALHLHTFACCQIELLLTASRADCLPGPWPNLVSVLKPITSKCHWKRVWNISVHVLVYSRGKTTPSSTKFKSNIFLRGKNDKMMVPPWTLLEFLPLVQIVALFNRITHRSVCGFYMSYPSTYYK